jgi:hypothetical protein
MERPVSLFGDLDVNDIPDDAFYVAPGTYPAILTQVKELAKDDGTKSIIFKYTIDDPGNRYHGMTKDDWFTMHPDIPWDEQDAAQRRGMITMKKRMREGCDIPEDALKKTSAQDLEGTRLYITVVERKGKPDENGETKTYVNIADVLSPRLYEEKRDKLAASDSSAFNL